MQNLLKYSFVKGLESKYQAYFKDYKEILILPPIYKKIGIFNYLIFPVIQNPSISNKKNIVKAPIGLIAINVFIKKIIKVYDTISFIDKNLLNLNYDFTLNSKYLPNLNKEIEENLKVSLDYLAKIILAKKIKTNYHIYLDKIKKFFPKNYFSFYEQLQNFDFLKETLIENEVKPDKEKASSLKNNQNEISLEDSLKSFKKAFRKKLVEYIKKQILPALKNKGSVYKLKFYELIGTYFKKFEAKFPSYYNCYSLELDKETKNSNLNSLIESQKIEVSKFFIICQKDDLKTSVIVDILSKILVVFMNSLLIEEIKNSALEDLENEIKESISIFKEKIVEVEDENTKNFLTKIFNSLEKDYITSEKEQLSDVYYAYLIIHYPFDL